MKETFIIRTEWHTAISELKPTEQAIIFNNLFYYHMGNKNLINLKNLGVKLVWKLIEPNLKRNIDDYDRRRETSKENGKLGGRPLKNKELEENEKPNNLTEKPNETQEPNETLSVFVTDTVIDIDNKEIQEEKKLEHPFSEDFLKHWDRWKKYKKSQHKFSFKELDTEQTSLNELIKLSGKNESKAIELINYAISKNWKGHYPIKEENATNQKPTNGSKQTGNDALLERTKAILAAGRTANN